MAKCLIGNSVILSPVQTIADTLNNPYIVNSEKYLNSWQLGLKKRSMKQSNKEHLKCYEDHFIVGNFSPSTIKAYQLSLRQFLEFRELHSIEGYLDQDQARQFILHK